MWRCCTTPTITTVHSFGRDTKSKVVRVCCEKLRRRKSGRDFFRQNVLEISGAGNSFCLPMDSRFSIPRSYHDRCFPLRVLWLIYHQYLNSNYGQYWSDQSLRQYSRLFRLTSGMKLLNIRAPARRSMESRWGFRGVTRGAS